MKKDIKIYLVDDDEEDRFLMLQAFKHLGIDEGILQFSNGKQLIKHLSSLEPDHFPQLIILDYNMPVLNGYETLSEIKIKNLSSSIKIVIYSTSINDQQKAQFKKNGALDCFIKPTTFSRHLEIARTFFDIALESHN
ncbi:response regulator [Longitalea luteola]|uniref:response regulator n=1 Tax=Longitalea luteola TaxID=2812563 RepID=UPI001A970CF2|nr:response regulator [Longitalea luteola]